MPNWRRAHVPSGTYFFTVVTDQRLPLFAQDSARRLLGVVLRECRGQWPSTALVNNPTTMTTCGR